MKPEELRRVAELATKRPETSTACVAECADYVLKLNLPGLIDEAFAERVNRLSYVRLRRTHSHGYRLSIYDKDARHMGDSIVTRCFQVAHILAAYGMEVPE